jgi:UDP-N-acetylglucosamine acyltransferase
MTYKHETSYIGSKVRLGDNNKIGQNVIIDGDITIGDNNTFGPNTFITNNVVIGSNNKFHGFISIGTLGEMGTKGDVFIEDGIVSIGSNNTFREFITINSPVRLKKTAIGNNGYFMARSHIPHDASIGDFVTMATNSIIGGGCVVNNYAYLGLGSITHQWLEIGDYSMIGMQAVNNRDVPPYCTVVGVPSKIVGLNKVGLLRRGIAIEIIDDAERHLKSAFNEEYHGENPILLEVISYINQKPKCLKIFIK